MERCFSRSWLLEVAPLVWRTGLGSCALGAALALLLDLRDAPAGIAAGLSSRVGEAINRNLVSSEALGASAEVQASAATSAATAAPLAGPTRTHDTKLIRQKVVIHL